MRRLLHPRVMLPLLLILVTLLFIWSNSLKDATDSSAQSGTVALWFARTFDIGRQPFRFIYENLRKVAHFLEFALLGAEVGLLLLLNGKSRARFLLLGVSFCAVCAAIDECIQYFVPGRACTVTDVFIDTAGSAAALLFLFAVAWICTTIFGRRKSIHKSKQMAFSKK